MLHEFLILNREAIIDATTTKAVHRGSPTLDVGALRNGVPLFLAQVAETLRRETADGNAFSPRAIADGATRHGAELLVRGFTVSEVVHFYGDICQAITELAVAQNAPVSVDEFRILNRSLDTAIAQSVTEHARLTAVDAVKGETQRIGELAHELRGNLQTALIAATVLKGGTVAVNGSTATVLARSLSNLSALIETAVSEVRLSTGQAERRTRLNVGAFLAGVALSGRVLADHHDVHFQSDAVDPSLAIQGDAQLLESAVMNLLQNAFKFTPPGGRVVLRTRGDGTRVVIEVEDQCGGIQESSITFQPFADRRSKDRSGLGLGLSIARQAVHAHSGEMHVRNVAGIGCIFSIDLPLASEASPAVV
jgi:signal transduction histidine kinase